MRSALDTIGPELTTDQLAQISGGHFISSVAVIVVKEVTGGALPR
jgi:bacteriocin-like protein